MQLPETARSQCQEINTQSEWKFSISDQRKATILRVSFGVCLFVYVCVCFVLACSCFGFPVLTPKLEFYEFIFYELCQVLQDKDDVLDCISWLQLWHRSVWIATIVLGLYNNFLASLNQNPGLPLQISQQACLSICKETPSALGPGWATPLK